MMLVKVAFVAIAAILLGLASVQAGVPSGTLTKTQLDTIVHENEVLRSEVSRLQGELMKKRRFHEIVPFGEDNPGDTPEECKDKHDKNSTYEGRRLAAARGRRLEEEEELKPWQTRIKILACMVAISAIIAISIGFEIGRDVLEEKTKEALKPILRNVFAELTILGFIGLIMFFATKYGKAALDKLCGNSSNGWFQSECFLHDCELVCPENPLLEEIETVHMVLFLVMMIFLSSVVLLVKISTQKTKRWRLLEDVSLTTPLLKMKHQTLAVYQEYREAGLWDRWFSVGRKLRDADERLRYAALRQGFIYTCNKNLPDPNSEHRLTSDFDFHEYVAHELNHLLIEMAEIPPSNWVYLWVVFLGFLSLDLIDLHVGADGMLVVYGAIAMAYFGVFLLITIRSKMERTERALIHHDHLLDEEDPHDTNIGLRINPNGTESKSYQPLLSDTDDHILSHKVDHTELDHHPPYKYWPDGTEKPAPSISCNCFKKKSGEEEDEEEAGYHEAMFWGGEEGVEILEAFLRCQLVLIAIYIGCLSIPLSASIWKSFNPEAEHEGADHTSSSVGPVVLYIVAIIPVFLHVWEVEHILPNLAIVTSVEEMVNNKGVLRTLRLMKSRSAMQALHNISCFMHGVDRLAVKSKQKALEVQIFTTLTDAQKRALLKDAEVSNYNPGQVIVEQGKTNDFLHIITDGVANVVVGNKHVAEMQTGREFGEISLLGRTTCKATVQAKTRMVCLKLGINAYNKHLKGRGKGNAAKRRSSLINFAKASDNSFKAPSLDTLTEDHEEDAGGETSLQSTKADAEAESLTRDLVVPSPSRKGNPRQNRKSQRKSQKSNFLKKKNQGRLKKALHFYRRVALSKIFACIDEDGGGEVDQEELERFLGKMFPGDGDMYEKQLKLMIEGLDEDGDGTVTEEEFLTMMIPIVEAEEENVEIGVVAKRMFEILDDDHSGEITTSEFKETLEKMGVMMSYEEVRELFHEYDDNLDGVMDEEEFIKMMCHQL